MKHHYNILIKPFWFLIKWLSIIQEKHLNNSAIMCVLECLEKYSSPNGFKNSSPLIKYICNTVYKYYM